jgi:hypothetical protein
MPYLGRDSPLPIAAAPYCFGYWIVGDRIHRHERSKSSPGP